MIDGFHLSDVLKHLEELRYRLIRIGYFFISFFLIFIVFRVEKVSLLGSSFPFIYPDPYRNISAQFLGLIESHVLPAGTTLIALRPTDGVVGDFYVAMFLSLVFSMPAIVYHVGRFVAPGLKKREVETIFSLVIPAALLFAAGAFFGIWFIAPGLFVIFKAFDIGLGASASMGIVNFVTFLIVYVVAFGLSFEIPVVMAGLTRLRVTNSAFWKKNWRYAVIGALVFGMFFSPGVTGFTMVVMAVPMIALYFLGIYVSIRIERNLETSSNDLSEPL